MEPGVRCCAEFPFTVSPIKGNIKPGKMENIRLNFFPTEASVYVGTIVCKQPEPRPALVMRISVSHLNPKP